MSWSALTALGITLRPFDNPPKAGGVRSPFDASLAATLEVLARELRALQAKQIVLQVGFREQDLRLDGMPRANATMTHDGVALSFESKWGPLRYETNEFRGHNWSGVVGWQANLRAIALGMEALRKVDRYGVSKRGEQYRGWQQLPERSSEPADLIVTRADAQRFLDEYGGTFREAANRLHPDKGGDPARMRAALKARKVLEGLKA